VARRLGRPAPVLAADAERALAAYAWPGNVRELAAVIERAAILGDGKRLEVASALGTIDPAALPSRRMTSAPPPATTPAAAATSVPAPAAPEPASEPASKPAIASLDQAMVVHIERALQATHGRIEGPFGAAKVLGINPHTLRARMRKLRIDWARYRGNGDS